jgi:serine palmitoyltransferase
MHNAGKPKEVLNLASYNFVDLAGDEKVKERAIAALRKYGVGSCSPPGFYGTIDVHMALEADIARFIGLEKCIIYSQGFSTISSVIPAFSKRGDIIVADKGVNFAIQKGIQISRSTIKWYDHNSISSLESVLQQIVRDDKRRRGPLTRRFIITEGIFENDGARVDLARIIKLKRKYKFRLILDESISFGTVGPTGRGMTELCDVPPTEVDMLVGSMANTLGGAGGFCAGSEEVVYHQRINGTSFVFSAALPAMLAVASSAAIHHLIAQPSILASLQENIDAMRAVLDHVESVAIPSDKSSALIHVQIRSKYEPHPDTPFDKIERSHLQPGQSPVPPYNGHDLDVAEQSRLLQAIVDDAIEHGIFLVRHKRLPSINPKVLEVGPDSRPSIRIAVSAAFTRKEIDKAAQVIKSSIVRLIGKRR